VWPVKPHFGTKLNTSLNVFRYKTWVHSMLKLIMQTTIRLISSMLDLIAQGHKRRGELCLQIFFDCFRILVRPVWTGCSEWYGDNDNCGISKEDTIFLRGKLPLAQVRSKKPRPTSCRISPTLSLNGLNTLTK